LTRQSTQRVEVHDLKESFYLGTRLLVFDKVRIDPQAPGRHGATITYNIGLKGHRSGANERVSHPS
jgi:NitT/TauT family transport system ATP-binding protein